MSKLNEAKALVDELKRRAAEQSALLKTKQQEADSALQEITTSMQVCVFVCVCIFVNVCATLTLSGRQDSGPVGFHVSSKFFFSSLFLLLASPHLHYII